MSRPPTCTRCHREARAAVSVDEATFLLCPRHAHRLAAALAEDGRVLVGRRVVRLEPPAAPVRGRR